MIKADKSKWFNFIFYRYNLYYLLRRNFHSIRVRGEVDLEHKDQPVLYVMNHCSWWDGLIIYHVTQSLSTLQHYMMMDEKQMNHYGFFKRIGTFSIDKSSGKGIIESLQYAVDLLHEENQYGNGIWIFPQGEIYHLEDRPLRFYNGVGYVLERSPHVQVVPVTIYYSLAHHQKTEVTLSFGQPIQEEWSKLGKKRSSIRLENIVERQLNEHRRWVIHSIKEELSLFRPVIREGTSIHQTFDRFRGRNIDPPNV
ncbi:lysophospholipid acyltransferase family protein [Bacillus horti]|uniref:1-acyl-sn-glycerol-3-phosphate acyltransferase n=1 Tax=Caldalkalibacillus horti TaxID=77523 RepID=A0ABT9W225_9BACI|nr:lysophospholipid acyltransferase family protein [Bacillus horti]MDQ0167305.1 1-acyl-sn-glycerol-3-phosphate acyltransferase [Bacillus horti]